MLAILSKATSQKRCHRVQACRHRLSAAAARCTASRSTPIVTLSDELEMSRCYYSRKKFTAQKSLGKLLHRLSNSRTHLKGLRQLAFVRRALRAPSHPARPHDRFTGLFRHDTDKPSVLSFPRAVCSFRSPTECRPLAVRPGRRRQPRHGQSEQRQYGRLSLHSQSESPDTEP